MLSYFTFQSPTLINLPFYSNGKTIVTLLSIYQTALVFCGSYLKICIHKTYVNMLIRFMLHVIYVVIVWYVVASLENTSVLELGLDNINSNIHQDPRSNCFNVLTTICPCLHFLIRRLMCRWKKSPLWLS